MANLLDLEIFQHLSSIFVFILTFVIMYGLLNFIKAFGPNSDNSVNLKSINSLFAFVIAVFVASSDSVSGLIQFIIPWFSVFIILIFFVFFFAKMFGVDNSQLKKLAGDSAVWPFIVFIPIVIIIVGFSTVFGQTLLETNDGLVTTTDNVVIDSSISTYTDTITGETISYGRTTSQKNTNTDNFDNNVLQTIVHPKMLGLILVMVISLLAILLLTRNGMEI